MLRNSMADPDSDTALLTGPSAERSPSKRVHSYSRLTTAVAVLALATSVYALWRLDSTRDRLDTVNDASRTLEADRRVLQAQLEAVTTRERQSALELSQRLDGLNEVPRQMAEIGASVEELRGRSEGPERAWSRAEALFLIELAQRRLTLERDVATAIVALEAADARLASLRDAAYTGVRQQLAKELQALRAVRQPDITGLMARLASVEEQSARARVKGISIREQPTADRAAVPEGILARAWYVTRQAFASLIVVRKVDEVGGRVLTAQEELIRRQHLQLLLFSARTALARHDSSSYRVALAQARRWLGEYFDLTDPVCIAMLDEIQSLEPVEIDPTLPELAGSSRELRRLIGARRGPE
jgi:uroporphyrin-3 C-methyltransferase